MIQVETLSTVLTVELCGKLADPLGASVKVKIPDNGCSVAELLALTAREHPPLAAQLARRRVRACVNEVVVAPTASVSANDDVALFPPVSGG